MRINTNRSVRRNYTYYQLLNRKPRRGVDIEVPRDFVLDVRDHFQGDGARPTEMTRLIAYVAWMLRGNSLEDLAKKYFGWPGPWANGVMTTEKLLAVTWHLVGRTTSEVNQAVFLTEYETANGPSYPVSSTKGINDLHDALRNERSKIAMAENIQANAKKPVPFI